MGQDANEMVAVVRQLPFTINSFSSDPAHTALPTGCRFPFLLAQARTSSSPDQEAPLSRGRGRHMSSTSLQKRRRGTQKTFS